MKNIDVNLKIGVYNEDLTNGYDESGRHIAILITGSQIPYDDINEKFIELPKNIEDVDLSRCFLRQHDGYEANISPCIIADNNRTLTCIYNFNIVSMVTKKKSIIKFLWTFLVIEINVYINYRILCGKG